MEQLRPRGRSGPRSEAEAIFGRRVREVRESLGLTQAHLADELRRRGVSLDPTMIAKMEKGTRPTNVAEIVALRWALQLDGVGKLFGEGEWTNDEFAVMQVEWAWDRLAARQRELKVQQEALEREADVLRKRTTELAERGAYGGEHPEAP